MRNKFETMYEDFEAGSKMYSDNKPLKSIKHPTKWERVWIKFKDFLSALKFAVLPTRIRFDGNNIEVAELYIDESFSGGLTKEAKHKGSQFKRLRNRFPDDIYDQNIKPKAPELESVGCFLNLALLIIALRF